MVFFPMIFVFNNESILEHNRELVGNSRTPNEQTQKRKDRESWNKSYGATNVGHLTTNTDAGVEFMGKYRKFVFFFVF